MTGEDGDRDFESVAKKYLIENNELRLMGDEYERTP